MTHRLWQRHAKPWQNVGDDFREGKVTLPVILSYRRGDDEERAFWKNSIENGSSDDVSLENARGLMAKHGSIAETIARARHFGDLAREALSTQPETPQKKALLDVVDFCISRVN